MTVIFKEFFSKEILTEKLSRYNIFKHIFKFVKNNRLFVRAGSLCLTGMLAVGVSVVAAGITLGFKVNYAGSDIATVRNAGVFDTAKSIVLEHMESKNAGSAIKTPGFKMTLTVSDRLDSAVALADAIIENTNDIVKASALTVNGKRVACGEEAELRKCLEERRAQFEVDGAENKSEFTDEVTLESGYYLQSEISSADEIKSATDSIAVKTVSVVTTDNEIAFSKKTVKTANEYIGYSKVTTKGENGISRKTESVETVNGEEISRTELSNTVIKEPVTEVTTVGTAKTKANTAQRSTERSAGFICPLKKGSFTISAYYGDGRGHKGMDLAADKGTPIYAVADGTVTFSGYDKNYGYCVVISHGNGLSTRYAHASKLCVSSGQTVSQGDVIAGVGSTGYSTGNHLHFEVMVNGTRVNPISYIGLD
ncbi:MAG: peptidoglycan DD-metalloendopeptidase family protein [Acutalibacteraceae bacterium]|nr:peptidoglycan DD-metalloendopeptidase family protein [Acutalibacteraceae bacterium]